MSLVNAELTKISINTYVTMKISFANTVGEICDRLEGADACVVADAIGRDTRIGKKYLQPALGYGGPCFPRDTIAFGRLAHLVGGTAELALATDAINRRQVLRLTEIVSGTISSGGTVAVLGLAYKPNTPVIEESQGVLLAKSLKEAGFTVVVHDPMAQGPAQIVLGDTARMIASAREAIQVADVIVIATPWPEYAAILPDWVRDGRKRLIIDCWRQLDQGAFPGDCVVVRLGQHETLAAAIKQLAAE
jgi:UDPglucose 6-dehydrogenase